ncbi:glycosyltransferase family 4 protein [Paenibacillus sp. JTLBN-2024]
MEKQKAAVVTPGSFYIPSGRSSSVERVVEQMDPYGASRFRYENLRSPGAGTPCRRVDRRRDSGSSPSRRRPLCFGRDPSPVGVEAAGGRRRTVRLLACKIKEALPDSKVVASIHSLTYISPPYMDRESAGRVLQPLDGIVVNSMYLKHEVTARHPALRDKISVNPLGVRLQDFTPRWNPSSEALREAKLRDRGWQGRRIVMYAGRLLPIKGVHHLLAALPELVRAVPDVMVLIVGSPYYQSGRPHPYERYLHDLAEPYLGHVTFIPFVSYPAISYWYHLADVVAVPSAEGEAFGLVNVEAMASAVPVVASDAGGIPEIVENGKSGIVLPLPPLENSLALP